ncbi:MAG: hypothetical protein ACLRSW_15270 [Christensenellaceae bacterium]
MAPRRSASAADSKSAAPSRRRAHTRTECASASPRPVSGTRATAVPGDRGRSKFLRALVKRAETKVLFTIVWTSTAYEEGAFVLYTESETIYRSLTKEGALRAHQASWRRSGFRFFVRLGGRREPVHKSLNELKEKFPDVKIDVK